MALAQEAILMLAQEAILMFEKLTAEVAIEMDKMPDLMKISDAPLAELERANVGNPVGY